MRRPVFLGWAAVWMGSSLTGDISGGEEAGRQQLCLRSEFPRRGCKCKEGTALMGSVSD